MIMTYEKFIEDNGLNYQIVEMKFKQEKSYNQIAAILNISAATIGQHYTMFSWSLYRCYFRYLKHIGLEVDATDIRDFYQSSSHAVAYLENAYREALNLFRGGKPPVFLENIKSLPPYKKLTKRQLLNLEKKIVKQRESQGRTFVDIGKELKITGEKTRWMYDHYYHKKVLKVLERIDTYTESDFLHYIFEYSNCSRKRWELIERDYSVFVQDLIDI